MPERQITGYSLEKVLSRSVDPRISIPLEKCVCELGWKMKIMHFPQLGLYVGLGAELMLTDGAVTFRH